MVRANDIKEACRKVVCIGRNYADHISELNNTRPKQPFFFLKPPTSILCAGTDAAKGASILRPRGVNCHYEVELGLIIGQQVRDLHPEDTEGAIGAIGGYLLSIDMTARNVQEEAKRKGLPWDIAKGFDTFLPISSPLMRNVSKFRDLDPHNLHLSLSINGQTKQSDSTNLMLFRIPRILSDISRVMQLRRGDIVLTGTPKGVGPVVSGDRMTAELRNGDANGEKLTELEVGVKDREGPYEFKET
ncbi:hypothetical protein IWX90DRAFT_487708 [Phyllosticta citrichinensis]|uniref:Fumarylacetoacetase-like C-terminal domain-containing protein n=1 Tax=Phyllosticta citrichinensis TaxID=1130410 RepID=A0ABR1XS00_9PEZI